MIPKGQSLKKTFIRFVVPSVAAQWVFALYTMVDGIFVARGVGETALSAVNLSLPFVTLLWAVSLMFAVGSSTIIAILLGQQKKQEANQVYTATLVAVAAVSLAVLALVLLNLEALAAFLGASGATLEYVKTYVGTIACFSPFFMVVYTFEILVKTDGHPRLAIVFVTSGAVLNCILDYLAVFALDMGIFGAALATGLSQSVVVVLYLCYFFSPRAGLRLCRFRLSARQLWRTCRLGLPSGITELSAGVVIFLFNNAIIQYINEEAVVSYTIVAYVSSLVVMSVTGITQGFQPLVSYYHGQGRPEVCSRLLRYGMVSAVLFTTAVFLPSWLFAGGIVSVFISPQLTALRAYSVQVFRIFSLSFLLLGYNIVIGGYFTAIEREKSSMLIALGRGLVFLVLSLWVLTALFGGAGIWWAATLSEALCLALTLGLYALYRKGLAKTGTPLKTGA